MTGDPTAGLARPRARRARGVKAYERPRAILAEAGGESRCEAAGISVLPASAFVWRRSRQPQV